MQEGSRTVVRACQHCGEAFERLITGRGSVPVTCSTECRTERERERSRRRTVVKPLPGCSISGCERPCRSHVNEYCETHYYRVRRHGDPHITLNRQPNRACHHCSAPAPINQLFCSDQCRRRNRVGAAGRTGACVTCSGDITQPFRKIYCSEHCHRLAQRGRLYGLAADQTHSLLAVDDGCAICGRTDRKLHIDHCHTSGRVRGLLCAGCNTALGKFRDDEAILLSAVRYLRRTDGLGVQQSPPAAS